MVLRKAYLYFSLPALFLHELSHLIMCILTFTMPFGFKLTLMRGFVKYATPKSRVVNLLINLSPLMNYLIAVFLSFVNIYYLLFLIYLLCTYKVSIPSHIDIQNIRNFRQNIDSN